MELRLARKPVRREGVIETVTGRDVAITFESICFQSDTPGALAIGEAIRKTLIDNGLTIAPAAKVRAAMGG